MKAIVYQKYGSPDVLKYEEIEKPTAGEDEVLIKIHAASVNPLDYHFMRGTPFAVRLFSGLRKPKITRLGRDVSGIVETVGKKVTQFKPGDAVYGTCRGAFAEYACTSESSVVIKPNNVTFEQAAAVPIAAFTALQALRDKGQIQHGQNVLINGAAGGVGTFAVQMAKSFGAQVTGVCSTRNMEMVRSIGADNVIDYTKVNFTKTGQHYDMIFDCYANQSLLAYRRALKENGKHITVGGPGGSLIGIIAGSISALVLSLLLGKKFLSFLARTNQKDLMKINELIADGKVTPVIDRSYGLSEVREAIQHVEEGHARGKVIITFEDDSITKMRAAK